MHIFRGLCASLLIFVVGFVLSSCTDHSLKANDVYLSVGSDCFSYANTQQDCMGIKMQAIMGNLYLYMPESDYCEEPSIFVFSKGGVIKQDNIMITSWHKSLWNDRLAGFGKGYLYIERYPAKSTERNYPKRCELVCYNLVTGELETLLCTEDASYMDVAFDENGYFYASTREMASGKDKRYQRIQGNTLLDVIGSRPDRRSGTVSDVLEAYNSTSMMLSASQLQRAMDSAKLLGITNSPCVLYPCASGWLLHTSNGITPLYLVSLDGIIAPVLDIECMTCVSSFNVYGDQAFLSFIRYEKWDDSMGYSLQPYENDSISGTYRIDLNNFAVTKINDDSYKGIFIFDENCIFAVKKDYGVYQLDTNGIQINTLIEPNESS